MEDKRSDLQVVLTEDAHDNEVLPPGISVSKFNYSVENHFNAMEKIFDLSGESEFDCDQSEIERLSSSVTFLREWRQFCYQPQAIRFACQTETLQRKEVGGVIKLPQFSSAAVPKDISDGNEVVSHPSKDFILYVGGLVWALDWCPRVHKRPDSDIHVEFVAVAAHPPESSYHKIGAPLTGRGVIQIWCVLNAGVKDQAAISLVHEKSKKNSTQKPRGRPRKNPIDDGSAQTAPREVSAAEQPENTNCTEIISFDPVKPDKPIRGVREKRIKVSADNFDGSSQYPQPLAVEFPEKPKGRPRNRRIKESGDNQYLKPCAMKSSENSCPISGDVALPRLVMCLAHNGKVAWDVKWRPYDASYATLKHRMGYLAVLLGNGALEVWDVPHPRATKAVFSTCQKEGTDPRFVKLAPVFRCSMLRCGDRQSIPLTLEWSTSSPHDLILAGCHDGVVALWKFSATGPLKDTRPLLCFSADRVPIRALAWAPSASDSESANIIITAGHKGAKFWDIRDPFRPLWDVNVVQRIIYSLDWLPDPRCVVLSFDDGGIRIISLLNAASDVPVTGKPFSGTHQQGLRCYYCSSSPIWSVQVSRLTGMLAYCCSDGTTLCSQLTITAVEKDRRSNHEAHYLCGSVDAQGSTLTVFSPLPGVPFPMSKSSNEWVDTPGSKRRLLAKQHTGKGQTPQDKPLALCYGNDPGNESGSDESHKSKDGPKQVFPPKMVAMHRVRWNMNKGSERWLCYGGAAGIVRCQEIR